MYHAGTDMLIPESLGGTGESGKVSQLQYGLEFGATWVSRPIIVRTSGGIGIARISRVHEFSNALALYGTAGIRFGGE